MGLVVFNFERKLDGSFSALMWEKQDPKIVAIRVANEWKSMTADPNPGDICWLKKPSSIN
jgi:hypothetical protein